MDYDTSSTSLLGKDRSVSSAANYEHYWTSIGSSINILLFPGCCDIRSFAKILVRIQIFYC